MERIFRVFYIALGLLCATLLTGCIIECNGRTSCGYVYVNGTDDTISLVGVSTQGFEQFRVSLAPNEEYSMGLGPYDFDAISEFIDSFTYSNGTVEWTLKNDKEERDIRPYRDLFDERSYMKYVNSERCGGSHTYVYKFVDEDFTETKPKN